MTNVSIEAVLWALISAAVSIVVAMFLRGLFTSRPPKEKSDSPAELFPLPDILRYRSLQTIGWFFAAPFAALVFVVCMESKAFVVSIEKLLETYVFSLFNDSVRQSVQGLSIPEYLYPLFVFGVVSIFFAPRLRGPINWFRDQVMSVLALDARADRIALHSADRTLAGISYDEALKRLDYQDGDPPMAQRLLGADARTRLAYVLIACAQSRTPELGLEAAIGETLAAIGIPQEPRQFRPIVFRANTFAAIVFYLVICGLYILVVPELNDLVQSGSLLFGFLRPVEWAYDRPSLALSVLQASLAFVLPLAIGMNAFDLRTEQYGEKETPLRSFIAVFYVVFLTSLFTNVVFRLVAIARSYSGESSGNPITIVDITTLTDLFLSSLAPAGGLLAWIVCRGFGAPGRIAAAAVCIASALSLYLCELGYEEVCNHIRGYYWHQLLLGGVIVSAYFVAASVIGEVRGDAGPTVPPPGAPLPAGL